MNTNHDAKQIILKDLQFRKAIYNRFTPDTPLEAGDPVYVKCSEVRGQEDILIEDGSNNHEEIFIDHSSQLQSLHCHVIYTVPISLVYSNRSAILRENYGDTEVLPMIMVRDHDRKPFLPGIAKIKQLITKRVDFVTEQYIKQNNLTTNTKHTIEITLDDLFDDEVTLNLLCEITGGHVREIMFLIQASVTRIRTFPITKSSLHKAIAISRNTYENQVDHQDWQKLVDIYNRKKIINEDDYRQLLFTRCVLEYREPDTLKVWHAVHPLIKEIWQKFEDYVKEDPEKLLRNCHPKKYPDCNCQLLAQKLLLKEPPKRLSQIYREFQNSGVKIPDQTLRSHWKKSVSPYFNKF